MTITFKTHVVRFMIYTKSSSNEFCGRHNSITLKSNLATRTGHGKQRSDLNILTLNYNDIKMI